MTASASRTPGGLWDHTGCADVKSHSDGFIGGGRQVEHEMQIVVLCQEPLWTASKLNNGSAALYPSLFDTSSVKSMLAARLRANSAEYRLDYSIVTEPLPRKITRTCALPGFRPPSVVYKVYGTFSSRPRRTL